MSSQGCKAPTHVAVDTCIRYELQDNEQALLSRWCVSPTHVAVDTDINLEIMRGDTCRDKNCKIMRGDTCRDKNCKIMRGDTCTDKNCKIMRGDTCTDKNCKIMRGDTCADKNCKIMRGDTCTDKNCQITSKLTFWPVCFHGSVAWGLPRQLKKAKFWKVIIPTHIYTAAAFHFKGCWRDQILKFIIPTYLRCSISIKWHHLCMAHGIMHRLKKYTPPP